MTPRAVCSVILARPFGVSCPRLPNVRLELVLIRLVLLFVMCAPCQCATEWTICLMFSAEEDQFVELVSGGDHSQNQADKHEPWLRSKYLIKPYAATHEQGK